MPDLTPVDNDPFANQPSPGIPVDNDPFQPQQLAPPSGLAQQVSGFPQRAADLGMAALGPIGEAGITVGDMLRTGHVDPRDIPQVIGGVMMGAAAPEVEEAAPLEAGAEAVAKGITAYHGSPYDFDKFDLSKIGTGEGAQAYGHGLYFAENPTVAQDYKAKLAPAGTYAAQWLQDAGGDAEKAKQLYLKANSGSYFPPRQETLDAIDRAANNPNGRMYQVSINADPEHFLDWDKPLSEQHPVVQDLARNADLSHLAPGNRTRRQIEMWRDGTLPNPESEPTGHVLHNALTDYGTNTANNAALTETLRQAGIPGIKYLDQGSRGSGNGTSNYVVFDDNLIDIVKKYGMAGLIAGGAAHFSTTPVDHDPFAEQSK